jgi:acetyl-CoA synthetase
MSIERLLKPRSIAVFGGAQAQEVIRQSDRMGYKGEIWPVHPKKTEILGRTVYRSVEELPESPDAAYVGVNRNLTIDIVRDLAARDAGGAICYATGFSEAGEEGSELEERLLEASGDMPLIGPNCYGLLNYLNGAMLWPDQQGGRRVDEGVAIITMSSNVGFNLTMQRRGLPVAPDRIGSRRSGSMWKRCLTLRPSRRQSTSPESWASPSLPSRPVAPRSLRKWWYRTRPRSPVPTCW